MKRLLANGSRTWFWRLSSISSLAILSLAVPSAPAVAESCHPNPTAAADAQRVMPRSEVVNLPTPLKNRLGQIAARNHSVLPVEAFKEADQASQLFQYYLLDTTGFEPNVFTAVIPGV